MQSGEENQGDSPVNQGKEPKLPMSPMKMMGIVFGGLAYVVFTFMLFRGWVPFLLTEPSTTLNVMGYLVSAAWLILTVAAVMQWLYEKAKPATKQGKDQ